MIILLAAAVSKLNLTFPLLFYFGLRFPRFLMIEHAAIFYSFSCVIGVMTNSSAKKSARKKVFIRFRQL